jgi:hypothetical protein
MTCIFSIPFPCIALITAELHFISFPLPCIALITAELIFPLTMVAPPATPTTTLVSLAAAGNRRFIDDYYILMRDNYLDADSILLMSDEDLEEAGVTFPGVRLRMRRAASEIVNSRVPNPVAPASIVPVAPASIVPVAPASIAVVAPASIAAGGRPPLAGRTTVPSTHAYGSAAATRNAYVNNANAATRAGADHSDPDADPDADPDDDPDDDPDADPLWLVEMIKDRLSQDALNKKPSNSMNHNLKLIKNYNNNVKKVGGKSFGEEKVNTVAYNLVTYVLKESSTLAANTKASYLKDLLSTFDVQKMKIAPVMRAAVLETINRFDREAKVARKNNEQNAHRATTERDILHIINSVIAEHEDGRYLCVQSLLHKYFDVLLTLF